MTRVLVCGGRDYADTKTFLREMDSLHEQYHFTLIIHGGNKQKGRVPYAQGADLLAKMWGIANNVETKQFDADWDQYGKSAGPLRNQQMINEGKPQFVIAFPGGRGTADTIKRARTSHIEVIEIR